MAAATDLEPAMSDSKNWAAQAGDYANHRYSDLNQINATNVGKLQVAWTMSTGVLRGHEGSPLVIGDTMYMHTPFPNNVYAVNLKDQSYKWKYEPKQDAQVVPVMCCDTVNRGLAYARRQDPPAAGGHDAGGAGCQFRQGGLDREERRSEDRRDQHQCAARLQGQGDHRNLRWRIRCSRTPEDNTLLNYSIFYICGPPSMLKAMQSLLQEELKISEERIRVEEFTGY